MKLQIKNGGGVGYARKEAYSYDDKQYQADLQNMDMVRILDSGEVETGQFGEQTVFRIKTRNGDKKFAFNQKTINVLIQEFGDDTENWVGKDVKVILHKGIFAGKKGVAAYLVTPAWQIDEYGEIFCPKTSLENKNEVGETKEVSVDEITF